MKIKQQTLALILFLIVVNYTNVYTQSKQLSKKAVEEDLNYLKNQLEKHHASLYVYSTPKKMDSWFENQKKQLTDSLTSLEFFKTVSSFSKILKDGHSYVYPSAQYLEDFFNSAPLFPLDVFLEKEDLMVINDCSNEQNIPIGSKLISINGVSIKDIKSTIIPNLVHDGDNLAYSKYLFYQFFPAYYSAFYGFQKEFDIEFLDKKSALHTVHLKGLARSKRRANQAKKGIENRKGISVDINKEQQLATITILSFDNNNLKNDYGQKFKKEINLALKTIAENEGRCFYKHEKPLKTVERL